ncbi:hypothetical protein HU219_12610 [Staphylococcus sp. SS35]|nr:hypothetical protein [Staphylococcus singaporensis]
MKIYRMKHKFYESKYDKILKLPNYQIIQNHSGKRPYLYNLDLKGKSILLPFRSNSSKIPNKYKYSTKKVESFRKNPAIDYTSCLVIEKGEMKGNLIPAMLSKPVFDLIKNNEENIEKSFIKYVNQYVYDKSIYNQSILVENSSLKHFHKELHLDVEIQEIRKQIFINELESNVETPLFKRLARNDTKLNNLIQLKKYKQLCQNESFIDPESDLQNPKLIIRMKDKNFKSISLNTINHLVETNNVSKLNDYFLLSKKHTAINKYNIEI